MNILKGGGNKTGWRLFDSGDISSETAGNSQWNILMGGESLTNRTDWSSRKANLRPFVPLDLTCHCLESRALNVHLSD